MTDSPGMLSRNPFWLTALLGLGIGLVGVGVFLRNAPSRPETPAPGRTEIVEDDLFEPEPLPPMKPESVRADSEAPPEAAKPRERPLFPGPMSESERTRLMQSQVQALREYAGRHGPDDPFSMTEEEIEAFRKKGNPFLE
jgi:hypothetical protein